MARALKALHGRVREALCALHGHDVLLQIERGRMFPECVSCGHRTPGWDLTLRRTP
jgi:hypothetical protein